MADPRERPFLCLACRAALTVAKCDRCTGSETVEVNTPKGLGTFVGVAHHRRPARAYVRWMWWLLSLATLGGLMAGTIAAVKHGVALTPYPGYEVSCLFVLGTIGFLVFLFLGQFRDRRVVLGVRVPTVETPTGSRHEGAVAGSAGAVVARRLTLYAEDHSVILHDTHTDGFSLRSDDGSVLEIPPGRVRLELGGDRARSVGARVVHEWLTTAKLRPTLFAHDTARVSELRAGDRVTVWVTTVETFEASPDYRSPAEARTRIEGVPTIRT